MAGKDRAPRTGDWMLRKDLERAAAEGRAISVSTPASEDNILGYLAGMDTYHLKLVPVNYIGAIQYVHKGLWPVITITVATLDQDPNREEIEPIVAAFRARCQRVLRGHRGDEQS